MEYKHVYKVLIGAGVLMLTLILAFEGYVYEDWSTSDALYMVVITIFGVGYSEVQEVDTPLERGITIMLILLGTGSAIYVIGGFVQMIAEGQVQSALGARRMSKHIKKMDDHVIICGFGRVGRILADDLNEQNIQFVVVDNNQERIDEAMDHKYDAILGDATDEETLIKAGIMRAKSLATVLPSDAVNVFITLTARNINQHLHIIARGETQSTEAKLLQAGANEVVLPATLGATRIAHMLIRPTTVDLLDQMTHSVQLTTALDNMGLLIDEFCFDQKNEFTGQTVEQIQSQGKGNFLILGLKKPTGETISNPDQNYTTQSGDTLIVMGHPTSLIEFKSIHHVQSENHE